MIRLFLIRTWVFISFIYAGFLVKINKGSISHSEVKELLKSYCKVENIFVSDDFFVTPSVEVVKKLVKLSPIVLKKYEANVFDCDDYSFCLVGLFKFLIPNIAMGIVWNKNHAYNFFVDEKGLVWGIEPQENRVFAFSDVKDNVRLMIL